MKTLVSRRIASYSGRVNGSAASALGACRPLHGKQLAGVPHGIDAKKEDVVDREHHARPAQGRAPPSRRW